MGFMSICGGRSKRLRHFIVASTLVVSGLAGSPSAVAAEFEYAGVLTATESFLGTLVPVGSKLVGPLGINATPGGSTTNINDLTTSLLKLTNAEGDTLFCFDYNLTCAPGETSVPIETVDTVNLVFNLDSCPVTGLVEVTAHSNTFNFDLPVSLDITNGTFHAEATGLGSVDGVGNFVCNFKPEITPSPDPATPLDFGSAPIGGAAGAPQVITIQNTGNGVNGFGDLNIGTIAITGNTDNFSIVPGSDECSGMAVPANNLPPPDPTNPDDPFDPPIDDDCTFSVQFTPNAVNPANGILTIPSDDEDESAVVYTLTATVTAGQISTDQPLMIADTNVGMSSRGTVTVTNSGTGVLNISQIQATDLVAPFSFTMDTCSMAAIPALGTCAIEVEFSPSADGTFMDAFTIVSDDPDAADASLVVNVMADGIALAPILGATPNPLMFADTMVNDVVTELITVDNSGTADLVITSLTGLSAPFSVTGSAMTTCSLNTPIAPGSNCTIEIEFAPPTEDMFSQTLSIDSNNSIQPELITISGTGTPDLFPVISLSTNAVMFGNVFIGMNSMSVVTVTNPGTEPLNTIAISIAGDAAFSSTNNCPASLATGMSCDITVTFTPAGPGDLNAVLSVSGNAPDSPKTATLSGVGVTPLPEITVTPLAIDSGVIIIGNSSVRQITVRNDGNADLSGLSVTAPSMPEFSRTNNCPAVLAPMASCTVVVTYSPVDVGSDTDSIDIASNDADEALVTVSLSGQGTLGPEPNITANGVSSVNFGTVLITQSAMRTVTISNNGSDVLNIFSVGLSGTHAGDYASTDDCVGALAIDADCTLTLTFTPSAPEEEKRATVTVNSDDPDTQALPILLTGTADQPEPMAVVSPAALVFAGVVEGDMSTGMITVTNSGLGDLLVSAIASTDAIAAPFSLDSETCTQAPITTGNSCVMMFTFAPGMAGDFTDTFNFDSNDATPSRSLSLAGVATTAPTPNIMLSASSLDLGTVQLGSTASMSVTVSNTGNADLNVSAASVAPMGDFSVVNNCMLVTMGAECTIDVTYTPTMEGAAMATLTITSDDPDTMDATVMLSGVGITPEPEITVSPSMSADLGSVVVGASSTADVVVSNDGMADLIIGMLSISGTNAAEFSQTSDCATVVAGASCTITVTYAPTVDGNAVATLSIPSNDADEAMVDVALSGIATIATMPMISAPAAVAVGDVEVGMSGTADIVVTNDGTADLTISNVLISGVNATAFAISNDACSTAPVASMATCTITVAFNPSVAGASMATVTITSDDAANPMTDVAVTGNGFVIIAMGSIDVSNLNFGGVAIGEASTQVLTITNNGNGALSVTGVSIAGADAASFSAPNVCATIAPASACRLIVSYSPSAGSSGGATMTITTNDPALASVAIQLSAAIEEVVVSVTSEAGKGSFGGLELFGLALAGIWVRRRKLIPLLVVAGLMASGAAYADEREKSGYWYIGAGSGPSTGQADEGNIQRAIESAGVSVTKLSVDDSDIGWKAIVGYQASERLGIEVGYTDLGTAGVDLQLGSVSVDQLPLVSRVISNNLSLLGSGVHGSVVFQQPFKENLAVFARVGLMAWEIESSISGTAGSGSVNVNQVESGTDFMFGVGAQMWLDGSRVGLSVEWERYELGPQDAELLTLNAKFRF